MLLVLVLPAGTRALIPASWTVETSDDGYVIKTGTVRSYAVTSAPSTATPPPTGVTMSDDGQTAQILVGDVLYTIRGIAPPGSSVPDYRHVLEVMAARFTTRT